MMPQAVNPPPTPLVPLIAPSAALIFICRCCCLETQEIFGSYGKVTSVDLAVDKRVNLPKV